MPLGKHLKSFIESQGGGRDAVKKACKYVKKGIKEGKITHGQIHLREMAHAFMGDGPGALEKLSGKRRQFLEAGDAVDASQFAAITGAILIQRIRERYRMATSLADQLVTTVPITNGNLGTQIEPWLSDIAEQPDQIQQGMPYPASHFEPQYVTLPPPEKWGRLCFVTMEMIFSDLTRQAMQSANSVGRKIAIHKMKRILKVILGIVNNHSWNGTTYNTYQATTPWVNKVTGNVITDWTGLETIEQLFAVMTDPTTGEVVDFEPTALLAMPGKAYTLKRVFTATDTRSGAYATSGATVQTSAPSPLSTQYPLYVDRIAYKVLLDAGVSAANAKEYVIAADFKRAFIYREAAPLQTFEAPPLNPMDFHQDISVAVKGREWGVAAVAEPRAAALSINA